jgi:predicted MFS family arabinose efflux permease
MVLHWGVARLATIVYFVQGALGLANVALPLYLRAQGFSIAKIAFISAVATAPWWFKILFGAMSDSLPFLGYRRKSYLVLFSILSTVGWILLSFVPPHVFWLILAMGVANVGLAATDVITDGLVVEHSVEGTAQVYQGISWGSRSVGAMIAGISGGLLAERFPAQVVFMITGTLPIISAVAAFFVEEDRVREMNTLQGADRRILLALKGLLLSIWKSFKFLVRGDLRWYALILVVGSSGAAISTPFFFFMREGLKFDEVFLGLLQSVAWIGAIVGCVVFLVLSRFASIKATLYCAFGLAALDVFCALFVQSHVTAVAITLFTGVLGYLTLLPLLSGAAKLTHGTGVEGSLFAILASLYNIGLALAAMIGGLVFGLIGLRMLIVLTACFMLVGFLIIPRLKSI